jgi:hypothetical protein
MAPLIYWDIVFTNFELLRLKLNGVNKICKFVKEHLKRTQVRVETCANKVE